MNQKKKAYKELFDACMATHLYLKECARRWHEDSGRVSRTVEGGAILVGESLDVLADRAARLTWAALVKAGEKLPPLPPKDQKQEDVT